MFSDNYTTLACSVSGHDVRSTLSAPHIDARYAISNKHGLNDDQPQDLANTLQIRRGIFWIRVGVYRPTNQKGGT